jgi:hypothetical protein
MDKKVRLAVEWPKVKAWFRNFIVFTAPALIVFFTALSNGVPYKDARYMLIIAGYGLVIDALKKLISTTEPNVK